MEVNEALKQVKILEKLKEKEEKKFNDHINYLEEKEADLVRDMSWSVLVEELLL